MRLYDSAGRLKVDMPGGGGGGTAISGIQVSDTTYTSGTVTFRNSNGISFGSSGANGITASYTVPSQSVQTQSNVQGIIVSNTTYRTGDVSFSNLNGISFGSNGANVVTASYTVPTQSNQTGGIYVTAQSTGQSSSSTYDLRTLSFIPDGIISAGWSGGSFRISATQSVQTQSNVQGIIVSNTTYRTGDVSFSNANGISFGSSAGQAVTASYTVPTVTNSSWTVSDAATSGTVARLAFTNLNGVTLSLSTGAAGSHTIVGSHNAITSQSVQTQSNVQGIIVSNTTYRTGDVSFSNLNGISFGSNGANVVTASYTVPTVTNSSWTVSDAATSGTVARLAFTNLNGVTLSLSTGAAGSHTIVGSHNALTSQSNQAFSAAGGSSAFQTLSFSDNAQASFTNNAGQLAITNVRLSLSATGNTTQSSTGTLNASSIIVRGSNIVSVGVSNGSIIADAQVAFSAAGGSTTFQTLNFGDTNSVSFTNTNGSVGIASIKLQMFAVSNTTQSSSGTANHTALSFGGAGIASVGITGGSIVISVPSGGGAGDGGVFAGVSTGGNTAGSTGTVSTGNFVLVGSNNITLSQSTGAAGSAATVTILGPTLFSGGISNLGNTLGSSGLVSNQLVFVGSNGITLSQSTGGVSSGTMTILGWSHISSYENCVLDSNIAGTFFGNGAISHAVAFLLPRPLSASFIRIPMVMTTGSTTVATIASATATASNQTSATWNAVVYSVGTGASSRSLISVASGSAGATFSQQISITNSTQYSISQGVTFPMEGGTTNRTTQYSISNTNYSFTTNQIATEFSGSRMIDIPFATSLSPGPYWLVFGYTSNSASGGAAGLAGMSACNVRLSNHYGASQANIEFGVMGSTNFTSGGRLGAGSFSTAGGGTTSALPMSAISSSASNPRWYFQMLRSA
jgi:hypothetical protein